MNNFPPATAAVSYHCEICGRRLLAHEAYIENSHIYCPQCFKALKGCAACSHSQKCNWETDPSPLPKFITKTIRQGPMIMQQTVPNPERIKAICFGCPCCHEETFCARQFNVCGNHNQNLVDDLNEAPKSQSQ